MSRVIRSHGTYHVVLDNVPEFYRPTLGALLLECARIVGYVLLLLTLFIGIPLDAWLLWAAR